MYSVRKRKKPDAGGAARDEGVSEDGDAEGSQEEADDGDAVKKEKKVAAAGKQQRQGQELRQCSGLWCRRPWLTAHWRAGVL